MDSSKIEVKKDVINEAIELFNVLRKNRKKSVNDVKDSFDVQNDMERGNLLGGIVNWSDAARSVIHSPQKCLVRLGLYGVKWP